MHAAAFEFVSRFATHEPLAVIEIGSRDINGTCRPLFPNAQYIGLDLYPGPAVDVACNALDYTPDQSVDIVLIAEVLEHTENWRELIAIAASWLRPDGVCIITCAGSGRAEHSAIDGQPRLMPGEYYGNRTSDEIAAELHYAGLGWIDSDQVGEDIQAVAYRPAD